MVIVRVCTHSHQRQSHPILWELHDRQGGYSLSTPINLRNPFLSCWSCCVVLPWSRRLEHLFVAANEINDEYFRNHIWGSFQHPYAAIRRIHRHWEGLSPNGGWAIKLLPRAQLEHGIQGYQFVTNFEGRGCFFWHIFKVWYPLTILFSSTQTWTPK